MKVEIKETWTTKKIEITDERSESSYGIPVCVIDGVAYGAGDKAPLYTRNDKPEDFIGGNVPSLGRAVQHLVCDAPLTDDEYAFCQKFYHAHNVNELRT